MLSAMIPESDSVLALIAPVPSNTTLTGNSMTAESVPQESASSLPITFYGIPSLLLQGFELLAAVSVTEDMSTQILNNINSKGATARTVLNSDDTNSATVQSQCQFCRHHLCCPKF